MKVNSIILLLIISDEYDDTNNDKGNNNLFSLQMNLCLYNFVART